MSDAAHKNLLVDRRFWPLFWTQFLGAFNDNVFKNALVILITFKAYKLGSISPEQMVALCGGIFILPFFLFSATAGQVADRYSKSVLIFWIKVAEIVIMLSGAIGFIAGQIELLLITLFLMGLQSTFFGPVKYSILPQLVNDRELVQGNALVEMGTFLSILLGTILGGVLIAIPQVGGVWVSVAVLVFSTAGCLTSRAMIPLQPANPNLKIRWNLFTTTWDMLKICKKTRSVFLSILGISWFWFVGAAFLSLFPPYCKDFLGGNEHIVTLFLALFSIGVGIGSILCERFSFDQLELGLVPIGSIGMSLFAIDLSLVAAPNVEGAMTVTAFLSTSGGIRIVFDLLMFSLFSGFFIVPLYTLIQQRSDNSERSRVIAGNNILNALFMVVAAVFLVVAYHFKLTIPEIFLTLALVNILVAGYIYTVVPEFFFRFVCWTLANVIYRLQVEDRTNIPKDGAAILVCNHVTFVDWMIISSATQRPIRFVMHYSFLNLPLTGRIFKDAKVIPIAGAKEDPKILDSAMTKIKEELQAGSLVCIFPEGMLTRDGKINPFRRGIEKIVSETPVPVIPLALNGMWGSWFSRKRGKKLKGKLWSRVTLKIGQLIPPNHVKADNLFDTVTALTK